MRIKGCGCHALQHRLLRVPRRDYYAPSPSNLLASPESPEYSHWFDSSEPPNYEAHTKDREQRGDAPPNLACFSATSTVEAYLHLQVSVGVRNVQALCCEQKGSEQKARQRMMPSIFVGVNRHTRS